MNLAETGQKGNAPEKTEVVEATVGKSSVFNISSSVVFIVTVLVTRLVVESVRRNIPTSDNTTSLPALR